MNNINQSFQEYVTYLYSTISMNELILYYFIIYLIVKIIQIILDVDLKDKIPNLNRNIMFIMTLVIFFEVLILKTNNFFPQENLLDTIVASSLLFILIIFSVKIIIKWLFNFLFYHYSKSSLKKFLNEKQNLDDEKLKKKKENIFNLFQKDLIQVFIDTFILITLTFNYWNKENFILFWIVLILSGIVCFYSYKENLIDKINKDIITTKRSIHHYIK